MVAAGTPLSRSAYRRQPGDAGGVSRPVAAVDVVAADDGPRELLSDEIRLVRALRAAEETERAGTVPRHDPREAGGGTVERLVPRGRPKASGLADQRLCEPAIRSRHADPPFRARIAGRIGKLPARWRGFADGRGSDDTTLQKIESNRRVGQGPCLLRPWRSWRAFAAEEMFVHRGPGGTIVHAKIRVGGSVIEMGEAHDEWGPMPTMFYVDVDDVAAQLGPSRAVPRLGLLDLVDRLIAGVAERHVAVGFTGILAP